MENILDDFEEEPIINSDIDESTLLKDIWLRPTETLAYILKNCPEKYLTIFFVFGGIASSINRASNRDMGDTLSTTYVLIGAIIGGGLFGWISYYIYAWALSETGKWLDGRTKAITFRTIIGWSLIPSILGLVFLLPQILIFGDDLFRSVPEIDTTLTDTAWVVFAIINLILGIWSMFIMVKGIVLVQDFTTGKAILNMILPVLVILGIILILGLFFYIIN